MTARDCGGVSDDDGLVFMFEEDAMGYGGGDGGGDSGGNDEGRNGEGNGMGNGIAYGSTKATLGGNVFSCGGSWDWMSCERSCGDSCEGSCEGSMVKYLYGWWCNTISCFSVRNKSIVYGGTYTVRGRKSLGNQTKVFLLLNTTESCEYQDRVLIIARIPHN